MAVRAVLARRLCLRYQLFFYIAFVLVLLQIILMVSFYSSSQIPALKNQLARWDFSRNALVKLDGQQPAEPEDAQLGRLARRSRLNQKLVVDLHVDQEPVIQDMFKCNVTSKDALSAIARAKTPKCQEMISNIVCLEQAHKLYPTKLPRYCPLKGNNTGEYVGCFKDDIQARIFPGTTTNLQQSNTPMKCVNLCLLTGFQLAGVEYSYECWCGHSYGEALRLSEQACDSPCPADSSQTCGGFNAMKIYHTGLGKTLRPPFPSPSPGKVDKVRIVFVLTVNGRALRQIRRLLKGIYHKDHYYYIHVDARQEYLYRELMTLSEKFDNIHLAVHRFASIWGGASLLSMLLQCMRDLLHIKHWKWNFFLNLSESDFPVKPLEDLVAYLTQHRDKNFVKSHGTDTSRFIRKQGLGKLFVECDTHMWRVGERQIPAGIRLDGGSDWVSLNRDFCQYLITSNDALLSGLKQYWKYSLLPAESFFHTVLHNSVYCTTIVNNNLHLTNWRRHQGCKCQYKHIVDWCGCSPNDFMPHDMKKIMLTRTKPLFFARKFEAVINQEVINEVEKYISGDSDKYIAGMNSYWQNEFHHKDTKTTCDDAYFTLYNAFVRLTINTLAHSSSTCHLVAGKVLQAHIYNHLDSFQGLLINFEVTSPGEKKLHAIEVFLQPRSSYRIVKPVGLIRRLKHIEVGTKFDPKEEIFRNFGSLIGPHSDVVLRHSWGAGTKGVVMVVYIDPAHEVAAAYDITIIESEHIDQHKPRLNKPLRPGLWNVKLLHSSDIVAETDFLVTPLSHIACQPITDTEALTAHQGPAHSYTDDDFSHMRKQLRLINTKLAVRTSRLNEVKTGTSLLAWIDSLASKTWNIVDSCYYGDAPLLACVDISQCKTTYWSSKYPDLKSEISGVDPITGKLQR